MLLSVAGCFDGSEVPAALLWLVVPISAIAVYPCSFVLAGILFAFLPLKVEGSRSWRAWLSGLMAAPFVFSPLGERIVGTARQWSGCVAADGNPILEVLVLWSPIQLILALVMAMTWALPPWRRPMVP